MAEKDPKIITLNNESTQTSGGYQVPDRIVTSSSGYAEETPEQKAEREAAIRASWEARGYEIGADGKKIDKASTLGDVLKMKEYAEQVEKANKIKATNAGVYNTLALLGDMISAGVGGDVYKREKNTIAEDAIKDTQAKKEAVIAAEKAAKEKDRERFAEAQKAAEELSLRYAALRNKVSSQTTEGYYQPEVKTTTTNKQEQEDKTNDIKEQAKLREYYDRAAIIISSDATEEEKKAQLKMLREVFFPEVQGVVASSPEKKEEAIQQELAGYGIPLFTADSGGVKTKDIVEPIKIEGGYIPTGW